MLGGDRAFQEVKTSVASEKVLTHYDPDVPLKLACDASPYGLGVVLSHVWPSGLERPVAFASNALTKSEQITRAS